MRGIPLSVLRQMPERARAIHLPFRPEVAPTAPAPNEDLPAPAFEPAGRAPSQPQVRFLEIETDEVEPEVKASGFRRWPFLLVVCLPLFVTSVYLFFIAADRYTSEASFVIRKGHANPLGLTGGLARNDDDSFAISAYISSRDAAGYLVRNVEFVERMTRSEADFLTRLDRFWASDTTEEIYEYMQDVVTVEFDPDSGISTLEVLAFRPEDAQAISEALLQEAERLVNRMNDRASADAIAFGESLVEEVEARIRDVQARMTEFRNTESVLDPAAQSQSQIILLTELTQQALTIETEIAQLRATASQSPKLRSLLDRKAALDKQIADVRGQLAGDSNSMAPKISAYEALSLERELSVQALTAAYKALEQARQEAAVNRLYLQRISEPNLPDRPSHPRIILTLLLVGGCAWLAYWLGGMLLRVTLEHRH
ncbi:Capsular polysaccharide export system inner membrane protein KpsE [Lutibaculum baratangense AMV1]|uniref:Capsular polysaccharide export system inner membrane protein KpsE n=1 Tax=Lutibaculum baratangense AMV1 TaxID=631454 RepID=V4T7P4_9HYPH|nr:Capsular polysaccharide export system inner membrane protein KpsE [Lutibaculum baratangense AMV1]